MRNCRRGEASPWSLVAVVAFLILVFGGSCVMQHATKDTTTFTVDRRERVNNGEDNSKYLVWITRDDGTTETLECTDTLAFGKFNSSDLYGRLKEGRRFKATVAGYRFGCTSSYRNIISIDEELPAKDPPKAAS